MKNEKKKGIPKEKKEVQTENQDAQLTEEQMSKVSGGDSDLLEFRIKGILHPER